MMLARVEDGQGPRRLPLRRALRYQVDGIGAGLADFR